MPSSTHFIGAEPTTSHKEHTGRSRRWWRFARHYLEMVVAMFAGMAVLGGLVRLILLVADVPYSMERYPALMTVEMGLTMAIGMGAWMRIRRHSWASTLEMSLAMLVPALAVVPLLWLDVLDNMAAMTVEHAAMFLLMLAVMVRRRAEYMAHAHGPRRRLGRRMLSVAGRGLVLLIAVALLPAAVFAAGSHAYDQSRYEPGKVTEPPATAAPPAHDSGKPTAVVVVGNDGANVADTLAPYHVLAATGAFNVYTVAPERRPLPLLGGLDLVPDLSFARLRQRLNGSAPDVTVVPEMPKSETSDAQVTAWLRETAADGLVLGVCTGARLLAQAGLLDGRAATSHWYRLADLQHDHPGVRWQRGTRYVDDGDIITTGGLLSSIDGALRVIERLVNPDTAAAAAETVGWRHYSPGRAAPLPESRLTTGNAVLHLLNVGYRANDTTIGVMLTDGVGELQLAAAFAPYGEVKAARTLAIASGSGPIRSSHGLTFIPRADASAAGQVDHLLVPGAGSRTDSDVVAAARRAGVPVAYLADQPGFAFDAALRELSRSMDVPTARWTAKILEYPTADLQLSGPAAPWTILVRLFLLGLAGLVIGIALLTVASWRRTGPHATAARPAATTLALSRS